MQADLYRGVRPPGEQYLRVPPARGYSWSFSFLSASGDDSPFYYKDTSVTVRYHRGTIHCEHAVDLKDTVDTTFSPRSFFTAVLNFKRSGINPYL